MGTNLLDKFLGFFGIEEEEVETEAEGQDKIQDLEQKGPKRSAPVLSLHTQKQTKVVILEPDAFDDARVAVDHLKNRRPVILNLEKTDHDLARRIVDFICGATYALDGRVQKIGKPLFLCVPNNYEIECAGGSILDDSDRVLLPWIRVRRETGEA